MFLRTFLQVVTLTCLATSSALPSQLKHFSSPIGGEVAAREPASNTAVCARYKRQDDAYNIYCSCGITLDATSNNKVAGDIGSQYWDIPINSGWGVTQGDVVGFICNYGIPDGGLQGSTYLGFEQDQVSRVCGGFIAGTWETQFGSPFDAIFGGYMRYTEQSINDICAAARASGSWVNTDGWNYLPFIC
jgi:hypothetical protein